MAKRAGYWVDMSNIQFDDAADGKKATWIQVMTLGTYNHPWYGKIKFTPARLQRFAENVKANVVGKDLDIDYDHKMTTGEAAGWIKDVEFRDNEGLFALVEWTDSAATKIKEGAYRYFSPEFIDSWKHPKSGKTFKDVLFGGGITNRPFLKDILPINMSETFGDAVFGQYNRNQSRQGGGTNMAKKFEELTLSEVQSLSEALGLPENASAGDVQKALATLSGQTGGPAGGDDAAAAAVAAAQALADADKAKEKDKAPQRLADGQLDPALLADVAKLTANNPALKVLSEVIERQQRELYTTTTALNMSEAQGRITRLNETAIQHKRAFPSVIEEDLQDILIGAPKAFSEKVFAVLQKLAEVGMVQLGELGRSADFGRNGAYGFTSKVAQVAKERNMSFAEASNAVASEDPQLYDEYRKSTYVGSGE